MTALERLAHQIDITDTFEAVVRTAICKGHEISNEIAFDLFGIDEMRHAELFSECFAPRIDVHTDNLVCPRKTRTLNHIEANATETEHDDVRARFNFRGIDHRADSCGHAATDVADLVEGSILTNLCERDLR